MLHAFSSFSSSLRISSSLLSRLSSTTRNWASCEVIGGTRLFFTSLFGESDRGGEHPGELAKSGWIMFDAAGTPTFRPGRTLKEPHAMRTWAGTRLSHVSKTPGTDVIVSFGISSLENPWSMLIMTCASPRPRLLLFWYHTNGALVVGSTDTMIPRRTGRLRRRSWKATPTSRVPLKFETTNC